MLVEPYKDATKTKLIMLSSYPEHVMGLAPDDLVSGTEIMAYKDQQLTGIAVMTVDNEYTNILLTTTRGDLKKVIDIFCLYVYLSLAHFFYFGVVPSLYGVVMISGCESDHKKSWYI